MWQPCELLYTCYLLTYCLLGRPMAHFTSRVVRCVVVGRCCELGRSLLSDRQMALQDGGGVCSSLAGYEPAYRACACVCGKGILRRDLRHTSPGKSSKKFDEMTHRSGPQN